MFVHFKNSHSFPDLSSQNEDDTFEILEAEAKPHDLDFEMVSRPGTGADIDLISVASSQKSIGAGLFFQ